VQIARFSPIRAPASYFCLVAVSPQRCGYGPPNRVRAPTISTAAAIQERRSNNREVRWRSPRMNSRTARSHMSPAHRRSPSVRRPCPPARQSLPARRSIRRIARIMSHVNEPTQNLDSGQVPKPPRVSGINPGTGLRLHMPEPGLGPETPGTLALVQRARSLPKDRADRPDPPCLLQAARVPGAQTRPVAAGNLCRTPQGA
jgi:hypothetical protein